MVRRSSSAATSSRTVGQRLPTQPVGAPILCGPYEEPTEHWVFDTATGEAPFAVPSVVGRTSSGPNSGGSGPS